MRILATISDTRRLAIVVDLDSGITTAVVSTRPEFFDPTVDGRASCRPFGITWSPRELFIANNRQLLVFDRQLRFRRIAKTRLQVNMHQIAFRDGRVWAVSPWTNSIIGVAESGDAQDVELDLVSGRVGYYVARPAKERDDKCHFNSLLWADGYLFVAAHAFGGPSFICRYHEAPLRLDHVYRDVGSAVHGLARHSGELFWLSTNTCEIRSDAGFRLPLTRAGYARGFAVTPGQFIVAISQRLARDRRHAGDSWVQVIDRATCRTIEEVHLRDTGSINDLRLIDGDDSAHGLAQLWATTSR